MHKNRPKRQPPRPLRIAIVGSRSYRHADLVRERVRLLKKWSVEKRRAVIVVSGTEPDPAKKTQGGVDAVAIEAARQLGLGTLVHPADWEAYGKAAGPIRNAYIVDDADHVIAFWDLGSRGTAHAIELALAAGKLKRVYGPDGNELDRYVIVEALREVRGSSQ